MSAFIPAQNIDEVIDRLNTIIDTAIEEKSAVGMFTALYVVVTEKIKEGIEQGNVFEDNARMEHLDVVFANRYLEAYHARQHGLPMTQCWKLAFDTADNFPSYIVLQELLTGMNAHVNLDLGIAAAEIAPGDLLPPLHTDFQTINSILQELTGKVRGSINHLSPRIAWIDRWFGKADDVVLDFSLKKARDAAWKFAEELAGEPKEKWEELIAGKDAEFLKFGKAVVSSGLLAWLIVWWVKLKESKDVPHILDELRNTARVHAAEMRLPNVEGLRES